VGLGALGTPRVGTPTHPDVTNEKLKVDVDPNLKSGNHRVKVQVLHKNGTWKTLRTTYATTGKSVTRTLNLKKGTYRVVVLPRGTCEGATSGPVRPKR
jgi:hypothetical protein